MNRKIILVFLLGLLCLCTPLFSFAEAPSEHSIEVIYHGIETISAERFYKDITRIEIDHRNVNVEPYAQDVLSSYPAPKEPVTLATFFPFKTDRLSVSDARKKKVEKLYRPIFIIGMDRHSLEWLRLSIDHLSELGAQGVVVQADSHEQFLKLQLYAREHGLYIDVSHGDPIAEAYGISTYPTLLMGDK